MGRRDRDERDQIEREAAEELRRVARLAGAAPPDDDDEQRGSFGGRRFGAAPPPAPAAPPPPRPSGYQPRQYRSDPSPPPAPPPSPPPSSTDRLSWTPHSTGEPLPKLSVEEEEELLIEMALHDWATQSGRSANPEDLVIPRADPASLEAQRDRALQAEMERQKRFREYRERNVSRQVPQQQRHGAGAPGLWVQRPQPAPSLDGLAPDLDQLASKHTAEAPAPAPRPAKKAQRRPAPAPAEVPPAPPRARKAKAKNDPAPQAPAEARAMPAATEPPAKRAPAKRAPAKKAGAKRASANKARATTEASAEAGAVPAATEAPAKKAAAKKAAAKRAPAKRAPDTTEAPARNAPTKRAAAKKAEAPAPAPAPAPVSRTAGRRTTGRWAAALGVRPAAEAPGADEPEAPRSRRRP